MPPPQVHSKEESLENNPSLGKDFLLLLSLRGVFPLILPLIRPAVTPRRLLICKTITSRHVLVIGTMALHKIPHAGELLNILMYQQEIFPQMATLETTLASVSASRQSALNWKGSATLFLFAPVLLGSGLNTFHPLHSAPTHVDLAPFYREILVVGS